VTGDPEPPARPEGKTPGPLAGHAAHADPFQDLVDPAAGKPARLGQTEQMVIGAPPAVDGFGVE